MQFLSRLNSILQTDFCPGANKFVYWLKEPVGWFVCALFASLLIGAFFSPIGWSIAAGLAAILVLGLGFPWVATRTLSCSLACESDELHEGDESYLILQVRNRLPLPVIGLIIENYFQTPTFGEEEEYSSVDSGLARIPALSEAEYRLPIRPVYRGVYPKTEPVMSCSFPFGIYTSRRKLGEVNSVLVRPFVLPLVSDCEFTGAKLAEVGDGNRPTNHGEFLGVREFQRGDSLRSIHWSQSAKLDELVVCERGGPQKSEVVVRINTDRCSGGAIDARENLAWRVRIAATLLDLLNTRHIPLQLSIDGGFKSLRSGRSSLTSAWDHLAHIPLDSKPQEPLHGTRSNANHGSDAWLGFSIGPYDSLGKLLPDNKVGLEIRNSARSVASNTSSNVRLIDLEKSIDLQLEEILQEVNRDCLAG